MNKRTVLKNISYTLGSNVLSFLISTIAILVVPKYLGVERYGYFQLYIFYANYIGFFHFGWADGVYLRYGGAYYEDLDKRKMSGQFWALVLVECIISVMICLYALQFVSEVNRVKVLICTAIAISAVLPRTFLQYVLQCTNRIKENAATVAIERVIYLVFVVIALLIGTGDFVPIITADLIGKIAALAFALFYCRDIVKSVPEQFKAVVKEAALNISVGIKLMFSNIASLLLIGIIRLAMERHWDISTFGKVSLSISVSNMLMVMVTAISLVMFPTLRRVDTEKYAFVYKTIRSALMIVLLGMLTIYFPVKYVLALWLPQYADSLQYMAILFPMCVFESKYSMLINTYMKAMRKEKTLLLVNVVSVCLSLAISLITVFYMDNLVLTIASIVIVLAFRCIIAELFVTRELQINEAGNILLEVATVCWFIFSNWFIGGLKGMLLYIAAFALYMVIKKSELKQLVELLLKNRQKKEIVA